MLGRFRVAVQYRAPAVASCYLASRPERAGLLRNEVKRDDGASPVRVVLGRTIRNRRICDPLMWRRRGVRFAVGTWAERGGEPFTHAAARGTVGCAPSRRSFQKIDQPGARSDPSAGAVSTRPTADTARGRGKSARCAGAVAEWYGA